MDDIKNNDHQEETSPPATQTQNRSDSGLQIGMYIQEGFNVVMAHPGPFILGGLILIIINSFVAGLLVGPMYAGFLQMTRKARRGETVLIGDAFSGFDNFGPVFIAGLVFLAVISIASVFCIVPAFLVAPFVLQLIPIVALGNKSMGEAFEMSKDEGLRQYGGYLLFFLALTLIMLVGALFCGVGVFFTIPVAVAALGVAYEDRFEQES